MSRYIIILFISVLLSNTNSAYSQASVSDSVLSIPMFYVTYAYQFPGGDLVERFGNNSSIGGGFQWKTNKNWIVGGEFLFMFGNNVKIADQIMFNLKTSDGDIISMSGNFTNYAIFERGYYISGRIGKLFPVLSPNQNSGIVVIGGLGYLQHKIRIEVEKNTAPQLKDDYKKGYDRLAGGFAISQFVGYMHIGESRLLNFFGGVEIYEAFTKAKRDVNFDTRKPDKITNRFDLFVGLKVGWMIPIFKRMPKKYYYY
ncbi:MAG: hypothetical protein K8R74_09535 [Bacteroidales bacterium]|nr:hypothetical protein [Bacteroidales bacterium]